jgi:transposase
LNFGRQRVELEYQPRRVSCRRCEAVRTEQAPWAAHGSNFTYDFEELTAYLAQTMDKTSVTKLMGIAWRTVGKIVERVVARRRDGDDLGNPRNIGIDEFSYRRFHRYMTVVVDHDRRRVIWCGKGRGSATLAAFFDELGPERCAAIEHATIDFSAGYRKGLRERLPGAEIIYDRFHVQQLASNALDEVRRDIVRSLDDPDAASAVKGTRWSLLKSPWDLSGTEKVRLADVERRNKPLFRAYLLKESLAKALSYRQPKRARQALEQWLAWASRSKLKPFVRIARTIRKYKEGILAYIRTRLTNGLVEGINNRLRVITRRAFGFHSFAPLAAMLHLCCGGIQLSPPLP